MTTIRNTRDQHVSVVSYGVSTAEIVVATGEGYGNTYVYTRIKMTREETILLRDALTRLLGD